MALLPRPARDGATESVDSVSLEHLESRRHLLALPALVSLVLVAGGLSGCGLLKSVAEAPGKVASAAMGPGAKAATVAPNVLQARLMRFADLCAVEITNATMDFAQRAGTPEAQVQALTWKLEYTNGLWRRASGPQPFAGLFDTIVVITAVRATHEERWLAKWGEADQVMIESLLRLEKEAWALAAEGLSEAQLGQVHAIVDTWLAGDPASRVTDISKLPGFVDMAGAGKGDKSGLVGELTALVTIDPLSGLEPTVREIEQSRQFAERAFYYLQRMPEILSARVELLVMRSSQAPEVQGTLASVQRVTEAAASIAATAEALPAQFSAEREAALAQISRELTAQREGLVHALETAQKPVTELLEGTRRTVEASRAMSDSLTETLRVLDAFVGRFDKDEESGAAPAPVVVPSEATAEPAGKPFDISEYGLAAERIGVAAKELGATIATLDNSLPEVQRVLGEVVAQGERSVDHAFARAFQLLAAALAGAAVSVLLVRRISLRWKSSARSG